MPEDMLAAPRTLAGVWTRLCGSQTLTDFENMALWNVGARDRRIVRAGKRYFYGRTVATNGEERYLVDSE